MERNESYGKSWADQWDSSNHGDQYHDSNSQSSNTESKAKVYGKKVGEGLGKTKAVASTGFNKMKQGTSLGLKWIKNKYQNTTTHKH